METFFKASLPKNTGKYISSALAGFKLYCPVYLGNKETVNVYSPFSNEEQKMLTLFLKYSTFLLFSGR